MDNDQRIAEIKARCNMATPGPWEWRYNSRNDYGVEAESLKGVITLEDIYPGYPECGEHLIMDIGTPDADFIAQAREDIPFLLSQLAERDKELKRLQKEVASLAIESIEREKTLAKLEAEVMVWAKAEQEGRLVVLPCIRPFDNGDYGTAYECLWWEPNAGFMTKSFQTYTEAEKALKGTANE